jgi:hypothetical protein
MSSPPRYVRELNFKVIKEDWFVYKLKDGTILRVKPVLVKAFETDQVGPDGKKIFEFVGQNIVTVSSPENLKGTPTLPLPSPESALKLDKEEVEIDETVYEPQWNIYELENGQRIKTKIVITHVYRIKNKYDEWGNPYYIIQSTAIGASSPEREIGPFPMSEPIYPFRTHEGVLPPTFGFRYTQTNFSLASALAWGFPRLKLLKIETQEISVNELTKYFDADEPLIKEELKSLLRSYEIPEEYVGRVEAMIRDYVKSELEKRNLPVEEWLINPLYKLFVHIAYKMLYV